MKKVRGMRMNSLRKEYISSFYRNNKILFGMTLIVTVVLSALDIYVAYLLQILMDAANGNDICPLDMRKEKRF